MQDINENPSIQVGNRLLEERDRKSLSQSQVADLVGVSRVMWGRYERGAMPGGEVLAALAAVGFDVLYILTGQRQSGPPKHPIEMLANLRALGIQPGMGPRQRELWFTPKGFQSLVRLHAARAESTGIQQRLAWGDGLLEDLAQLPTKAERALHLQAVTLMGHVNGRKYRQLLIYEARTPPYTPWSLSPAAGLAERYELDATQMDFPVDFLASSGFYEPVLVLSPAEVDTLERGDVLSVA